MGDKMYKSLVIKLPKSLHTEFKAVTSQNEESMSSIVIGGINKYIADKKKVVIH